MKGYTHGHIKLAMSMVRANRWRSFLTMLGIIIGVASVISVVSIGEGVKQQVGGQITKFGKDLITVRPGQGAQGLSQSDNGLAIFSSFMVSGTLSGKDVDTVATTKGVRVSSPLSVVPGAVKGDHGGYDGLVIGTNELLPQVLNHNTTYGAFFTADDTDAKVAVLGQQAAVKLFSENIPLGRTFTLRGQEFIVRGIFDDFDISPLSADANFNDAIFIPYDVAQDMTNHTAPTYEILAKPDAANKTNQVVSTLQAALTKTHHGQQDFRVLKSDQSVTATNKILDLLTRLIGGIAAISLLVGGVGIMNVMLVSVTERMHEVGIRKAVGATNWQILSQFVIEATVLSLVGGVIGILTAFLLDLILRLVTDLQPVIRWQVVLLATVVSILVGIIFGSAPALKAARKDPITALRNE